VLERDYTQFAKNDISFLGLQFFVAGLHDNISLEVIKSGTTDMYEAFLVAHAYETAVKDKKKNNGNGAQPINNVPMEAMATVMATATAMVGNQQSGSGGQRKPNPAFCKICHYCKKKNHFQNDCYKRKRDNAPPVKVQELNGQEDEGNNVETVFRSKN